MLVRGHRLTKGRALNRTEAFSKVRLDRWQETVRRLTVFGVVGCANTLLDFSIYTVLVTGVGMAPLIANLFSFTSGGISSFLLNRRFTFQATNHQISVAQVARFVLVTAVCLAVSSLAIYCLLLVTTALPAKIGSVIATFLISYALQRTLVFGRKASRRTGGERT